MCYQLILLLAWGHPGYNFKVLSCTPTYLNPPISQFLLLMKFDVVIIIVVIIIIIIIAFQTANPNWDGRKPKTQRPQQGRQPSKERENFIRKRKQQ